VFGRRSEGNTVYYVLEWLSTGFWIGYWIYWQLIHTRLGTTSNYSATANHHITR
jgi:hypothetical protein